MIKPQDICATSEVDQQFHKLCWDERVWRCLCERRRYDFYPEALTWRQTFINREGKPIHKFETVIAPRVPIKREIRKVAEVMWARKANVALRTGIMTCLLSCIVLLPIHLDYGVIPAWSIVVPIFILLIAGIVAAIVLPFRLIGPNRKFPLIAIPPLLVMVAFLILLCLKLDLPLDIHWIVVFIPLTFLIGIPVTIASWISFVVMLMPWIKGQKTDKNTTSWVLFAASMLTLGQAFFIMLPLKMDGLDLSWDSIFIPIWILMAASALTQLGILAAGSLWCGKLKKIKKFEFFRKNLFCGRDDVLLVIFNLNST
eukprot:TRINITY_DN3517_c0_g2_i4.p1 TRINITY_DN3517_c0_g2~~TRINITY_DN3517_c0_g2_i4.p1  ORF type:complete len:313 (-),score=44.68 TRINITY_DN3517_c0_g2_i4:75-1013(-)